MPWNLELGCILIPAGVESSCACHTVPSAKTKEDIGEENQATRRIA